MWDTLYDFILNPLFWISLCWILTNEMYPIGCSQNYKMSRLLIGYSTSTTLVCFRNVKILKTVKLFKVAVVVFLSDFPFLGIQNSFV